MVIKLWRLIGYRIRVPRNVTIFKLMEEMSILTPCVVVEELDVPGDYVVVIPEGMHSKFESYFKQKGYRYLPADVYLRVRKHK